MMRPAYALALVVVVISGVFVVERTTRFDPGANARVTALTTDPIRVELDFSPDLDEVAAALSGALAKASVAEGSPEIAKELEALAADGAFVSGLASSTVARLRTDAAALAYSTTSVTGSGAEVTIIGITIEMLPKGRRDGISRNHEDGHAAINNGIVENCGHRIVAFEVEAGSTGNELVERINNHLALLEDLAHAHYHVEVSDGVFGSHGRAASRALEAIERNGCLAYAT